MRARIGDSPELAGMFHLRGKNPQYREEKVHGLECGWPYRAAPALKKQGL